MVQDAVVVLTECCGDQLGFERSCDVGTRLDENEAEGTGVNSLLVSEMLLLSHIVATDQTQNRKR